VVVGDKSTLGRDKNWSKLYNNCLKISEVSALPMLHQASAAASTTQPIVTVGVSQPAVPVTIQRSLDNSLKQQQQKKKQHPAASTLPTKQTSKSTPTITTNVMIAESLHLHCRAQENMRIAVGRSPDGWSQFKTAYPAYAAKLAMGPKQLAHKFPHLLVWHDRDGGGGYISVPKIEKKEQKKQMEKEKEKEKEKKMEKEKEKKMGKKETEQKMNSLKRMKVPLKGGEVGPREEKEQEDIIRVNGGANSSDRQGKRTWKSRRRKEKDNDKDVQAAVTKKDDVQKAMEEKIGGREDRGRKKPTSKSETVRCLLNDVCGEFSKLDLS
jgi:hypothetical protein